MKNIFLCFLLVSSVSAFCQEPTFNDKNAVTRNVPGFNAIRVSGSIEVYLSQGNTEAVAVSASEEKFRDKLKTEVVNGTLKIYYDGDKFNFSSTNKKLKAYVSCKNIEALDVSGASDLRIAGTLKSDVLRINLSGASELEGVLNASRLTITASGASDAKISGEATSIDIEASGASDVKGYEMKVDDCTAKATGASDIHLTVNKQISAHASGASSVSFMGEAVMKEIHTSGASSVGKKS
ncbi:MAG: head GIN domain-containing protein [Ginsengibacter sp.]